MQPSKYSKDTFKMKFGRTRRRLQKYSTSAVLSYEELRGLSDPGTRDCPRGTLLLGYGMGHGPRPTSFVATRNAVGLLVQ
jgi:hypothetical protein